MQKVGYTTSPLEDGSLDGYHLHPVPLTTLTVEALKEFDLTRKEAERSKNMFALGLLSWMYHRPTEGTEKFLKAKFAKKPDIAAANIAAYRAGWNFGETTEDFAVSYEVAPAATAFPPGTYRNISGNLALAYGLIAASRQADLPLFLGSYPITPASDILHELSRHKNFGVRTFQAEDEIAGIGAALRAAFGGSLAVTTTSGPGVALKSETIGLAVSLELPLLVVDIQRGGPSTGLPTKTEQADLLQAMYGRNGEAPVPVIAPRTPADCFDAALEAARIALAYRTPVFLPLRRLPRQRLGTVADPGTGRAARPPGALCAGPEPHPGRRHRSVLALQTRPAHPRPPLGRPGHPRPGTPHRRHRKAGRHREHLLRPGQPRLHGPHPPGQDRRHRRTGCRGRRPGRGEDPGPGWGSTYGPITRRRAPAARRRRGRRAGPPAPPQPLPNNLGAVLESYDTVVIPEMNLGQLATLVRAKYLVDAQSYNQVNGMPFKAEQLATVLKEAIDA